MTLFYQNYFNSLSLAGGFYRVGAPQIKQLPIIIGSQEQQDKLITATSKMIENPNEVDCEMIDNIVFEIYGISDEDASVLMDSLK